MATDEAAADTVSSCVRDISAAVKAALTLPNDSRAKDIQSDVLRDMSHVFLDFSMFVTQSQSLLRVAQVIGRVICLVKDYLPDQHVASEELAIQLFLIAVSVCGNDASTSNLSYHNKEGTTDDVVD